MMSLSLSLPAVAVGKPVIAKIADVASRAYAYLGVCAFVSYLSFHTIPTLDSSVVLYNRLCRHR